jgi:chromosome segregation ATPase|tara:strand:- start:697 stop:1092 length:396 start_codon:yes stop_codon:yes gene_type:complete
MGFKLAIMSFVIMAVMAGGFILYYKHTQEKIATLHQNNAKLEGAVESQKAAIESMDENFTKQSKLVGDLQIKLSEAEDGYKKLASKLRRHDLEELSRAKPGLMENRINKGTARLILELEEISGVKKPAPNK